MLKLGKFWGSVVRLRLLPMRKGTDTLGLSYSSNEIFEGFLAAWGGCDRKNAVARSIDTEDLRKGTVSFAFVLFYLSWINDC